MYKRPIIKLSNPWLFQEIKSNLPCHRKISQIEIRVILKQNQDRLIHNPNTKDFRSFLKLAKEAFEREDFKEAYIQINRTILLLHQSSPSQNNIGNLNKIGDLDRAQIYELASKMHEMNYKIKGAIYLLEKSLRIRRKVLGDDNIYSQSLVFKLAHLYFKMHMVYEAIIYFKIYLSLRKERNRKIDQTDIYIMVYISVAYKYKQGSKTALNYLEQTLRLNEKYFGKNNIEEYRILLEMGNIYSGAKKRDKAKAYYIKCLNMLRNRYSLIKISKLSVYDLLIKYYKEIEMYDRSLDFAKKAIRDLKQSRKDNFYEIAKQYESIYMIYSDMNNIEKGLHYYYKYMILFNKILGPRHPDYLIESIECTQLLCSKGLCKEALKILKKSKKELNIICQSSDFLRAIYKQNKGTVYYYLKRTRKSSIKLEEAKRIFLMLFGENHPAYLSCCFYIAAAIEFQNYLDKSLEISKCVFEKSRRLYSDFHFDCARLSHLIAALYFLKGKFSSSLKYCKISLNILIKIGRENSYFTKIIYLTIANMHRIREEKQRFIYYFRKAIVIDVSNDLQNYDYYICYLQTIYNNLIDQKQFQAAKKVKLQQLKFHISSSQYNLYDTVLIMIDLATNELEIDTKNYPKAIKLFMLCKKLYEIMIIKKYIKKKDQLLGDIYLLKAQIYKALGKYQECLSALMTALKIMRHFYRKYEFGLYVIYMKIAWTLQRTGKYYESIQMVKRALRIHINTIKNPLKIVRFYQEIGLLYYKLTIFDKTLEYWEISLRIQKRNPRKDIIQIKNNYNLLGVCYIGKNRLDLALKYFKKALLNTVLSSNMDFVDTCSWNNIAHVYVKKELIQDALEIFKLCVKSAKANKFEHKSIETFICNYQATEKMNRFILNSNVGENRPAYHIILFLMIPANIFNNT